MSDTTLIDDTVDGYARKYLIPASNYVAAFIRTTVAVLWGSLVAWVTSVNTDAGEWISDQGLLAQAAAFALVVGVVNFVIAWAASKSIPLPKGRRLSLKFLGYLLIVNKKPNYQPPVTGGQGADASGSDHLAASTDKPDGDGDVSQDPDAFPIEESGDDQ